MLHIDRYVRDMGGGAWDMGGGACVSVQRKEHLQLISNSAVPNSIRLYYMAFSHWVNTDQNQALLTHI